MSYQEGFKYGHKLTNAWKRYAFTFKSGYGGGRVVDRAGGRPVWVDGIQVEKGTHLLTTWAGN